MRRRKNNNWRGGNSSHQFENASGSSSNGHNNSFGRRRPSSSNTADKSNDERNSKSETGRKKFGGTPNIGFKYLESMLDKPVEEVMNKLNANENFFKLLDKNLNEMGSDFFILLVRIIAKFCDCEFSALRARILQKSMSITFIQTFQLYITKLPLHKEADKRKNSYFWKDPDAFWYDFLKICKTLLKEIPRLYAEQLFDLLGIIDLNLPHIEHKHSMHINDGVKNEFKNMMKNAEDIISELTKSHLKNVQSHEFEGEPPNDFREISVYPTAAELIDNQKPFLRKNVISGPYRDVNHYLDIQFRLLREDFVGPLRGGINSYLSKTEKRLENVRIHKKVQFIQPEASTDDYCVLLKFHFGKNKISFKYENSKRFMFGSLVCFTRDNFKSLIFGRIVDRKDELLQRGELIIGFDSNELVVFNRDYLMVECSIYFEPYYHVLNVMKLITEEDFPMKRYIVDVKTDEILPEYLTPQTIYRVPEDSNTHAFLPFHKVYKTFDFFNPSQNAAFNAALTREFSIIQGPPGTGKTYVGLKIASTLLTNCGAWFRNSPMLIVCYTNHALDQFLEGLLETTDEIIRIGGQSKNDRLKKLNLRSKSRKLNHSTYLDKLEVTNSLSAIKKITESLKCIGNYNGIISPRCMERVIPQFSNSWLDSASDQDFLTWLVDSNEKTKEDFIDEEFKNLQLDNSDQNNMEEVSDEESNEEQNDDTKEELDELLSSLDCTTIQQLISLPDLEQKKYNIIMRLKYLEMQLEQGNQDFVLEYMNLRMEFTNLDGAVKIIQEKMDLARTGVYRQPPKVNTMNSQYIPREERWSLYFHWVNLFREHLLREYERENHRYRGAYRIYCQSKDMEDIATLREAKVIGLTTTGASRLHSTLATIKSPIVIVEEAAEVLEAHIVTSLTKHCKQLILIGDHQQLKPSTSNYQVEKFYNLGISLFERMILNKVQCFTLNVQHRMRPEISSLIKPTIYPELRDHESVMIRPNINGVEKCLYFIDHEKLEESEKDGTSKKNTHEVKFLIQLARYLILNGYKANQITILAAYLGQMFEFQKEKKHHNLLLKDVKIAVLDNYQGEECDIILLSLVRSNTINKIGFLSIENRVCVALSRARNGLYIMGNMKILSENSELWIKIRQTLRNQNSIGTSLSLKCKNHNKITLVTEADDFSAVSEGGCDKICGALLNCGHTCSSMCHIQDMEHQLMKCQEECLKSLCDTDPLHVCRKRCFEKCGPCEYKVARNLNCGHTVSIPCHTDIAAFKCITEVSTELPCGHTALKPCHVDPYRQKCPIPCDTRLDCGHACLRNCHVRDDPDHLIYKCTKPCEKYRVGCTKQDKEEHKCPKLCFDKCLDCKIIVKKRRTVCPHFYDVPCNMNPDEIECAKPCKEMLSCGHKCQAKCHEPCGPCNKKVKKTIPECNHVVELPCCQEAEKRHCKGRCPRKMTCGHVCGKICRDHCDPMECKKIVEVSIPAKCGHSVKQLPCYLKTTYYEQGASAVKNLESYCREPCQSLLKCGKDWEKHSCKGSCGECSQGRFHRRCAEKCGQILVCNHECEVFCRETCKPCEKKCTYKCEHSSCKKKCGEPCSECVEPCPRKCMHQTCRRKCGEVCEVPPCNMPCHKKLKCGHDCVGFCGDTCPPLCRICDKEKLQEIFFGTEDDEEARFVLLQDCGHVVESEGMEQWMALDSNTIMFKQCPRCKTNISTTERYSNYVKQSVQDVMKVKVKHYGTIQEINHKKETLKTAISDVINKSEMLVVNNLEMGHIFIKYYDALKQRLMDDTKDRIQRVNLIELNSMEIKFQLMQEIHKILEKLPKRVDLSFIKKVHLQLKFILNKLFRTLDEVTTNEIEDTLRENNRLNRIINFCLIMSSPQASHHNRRPETLQKVEDISSLLYSLSKYEETVDEKVKQLLKDLEKILATSIGITEKEKREIVAAIGLAKGHWFKCPNGHPYAIADCGGAMVQSVCNECKAPIGGSNHQLLASNRLATEMDGAVHAAWSEAANMANYRIF